MISVELSLEPRGKGRPRSAIRPRRPGPGPSCPHCRGALSIHVHTDRETEQLERQIAFRLGELGHATIEPPVAVRVEAITRRPKRLMRKKDHPGRVFAPVGPDVDNVAKLVLDALQRCGSCGEPWRRCKCPYDARPILLDDRHVVRLEVEHRYAAIADRATKRSAEPALFVRVERVRTSY